MRDVQTQGLVIYEKKKSLKHAAKIKCVSFSSVLDTLSERPVLFHNITVQDTVLITNL